MLVLGGVVTAFSGPVSAGNLVSIGASNKVGQFESGVPAQPAPVARPEGRRFAADRHHWLRHSEPRTRAVYKPLADAGPLGKAPQTMLFSVVVVNWNSLEDLRSCLSSLRVQTHQELEVIVVDNGSADGSADMVAREFADFRLLRETENLGFAEACNRGILASNGEWVAMLNNDAVAEPDWAEALVRAATDVPRDCGMLQSLLLYQSKPDIINSTGIELHASGGGGDRSEGLPRAEGPSPGELFCPTAGAAAYRRSMLEAIRLPGGYFDAVHFMYFEDMDLGWRARLAGYSAHYVPSSVVYHRWHGSTVRRGRSWLTTITNTNQIRTLLKNASAGLILRSMPSTLKGVRAVARHGGLKGIVTLTRALGESLVARGSVTKIATIKRHDVEARWVNRSR